MRKKQSFRFFILHTLARQLRNWADFLSRQPAEEQENQIDTKRAERNNMVGASPAAPTISVVANQTPMATRDIPGVNFDNPPAHWLSRAGAGGPMQARTQKDTPELLKQKKHSSQVSGALPAIQANNSVQAAHTEQRVQIIEITQAEERSSRPTKISKQHTEKPVAQGEQADISASPHSFMRKNTVQRMRQDEESTQTSESHVPPIPLSGEWPGPEVRSDPPSWKERPERHSIPQSRQLLWPQASTLIPTDNHQARDQTRELRQIDTRWPSLPQAVTTTNLDRETSWQDEAVSPVPARRRYVPPMSLPRSEPRSEARPDSSAWKGNLASSPAISDPASETTPMDMRWPSLPQAVTTTNLDWETARRIWERQQRLDEEQRGSSWNA